MERIVIEVEDGTKKELKELGHREEKTMKTLLGEAIKNVLRRLK